MAIGTTAAILGAAAIGGIGSIAAGAMQAGAANQAAQTQAQAADKALALQKRQYEEGVKRQQPWIDAGRTALDAYMGELGVSDAAKSGTFKSAFRETPGYGFQVEQGEQGVLNNLSALGMRGSGAGMKALTRFRQGLADQTYNNYLDRLSGASVGGQASVSNQNALGQNFANNASQTIQDAGAARASGYVGAANAWGNALGNLTNQAGFALGGLSNNYGQGFGFKFA